MVGVFPFSFLSLSTWLYLCCRIYSSDAFFRSGPRMYRSLFFSFFNVPLINYSRSPHAPFSLSCFSTLFDSPKRRRLSLVVVCLIVLMRVSVCGTNSDQFQFFSPDDAVGFSFFFFVERIFFSCFFDFFFFFIFPHFLLSISLYFSYFSLRSASFFPLPFNVKKGGNELCQRCQKKKKLFFLS